MCVCAYIHIHSILLDCHPVSQVMHCSGCQKNLRDSKNLELILVSAHVYIHVCTSINIHLQIHKHIYICRLYIYTYLSTVAFSHQVLKESSHRFKKKAFQFTPVSSSFICASRTDIYVCMYMDVRKYINILYIYTYTFRIALQVHLKCQNISIHQLPAFFHTFQPHSHAPSKEHWTTTWSRDVAARSMAQSQPVETTSKYIYTIYRYIHGNICVHQCGHTLQQSQLQIVPFI